MTYLYWLLGAVGVLSYTQFGFQMARIKDRLKNEIGADSLASLMLFPYGTYRKEVSWNATDAFHALAIAMRPLDPKKDAMDVYENRRTAYIALHVLGWPLSVIWSIGALSFVGPAMFFDGKLKKLLRRKRVRELPENTDVFVLTERRRLHLEEVEKIESELRKIGGAIDVEKHLDSRLALAIEKEDETKNKK